MPETRVPTNELVNEWVNEGRKNGRKEKNMKGCHVKWMTCWRTDVNIDFGAVRSCDRLAAPVWLWTNLVAAFPHLPSVEKGITHSEVWRLCLMIFQLTWHLNDFRICCPSVGQPKLWGGFSEDPSFHLLQKTRIPMVQKWQPSSTTDHTKAATDLRSRNHRCFSRPWHSSWHCRTMGVSKSYGANFWCPSDIILICTKKWLLCMTSLPYELVCSQNQLLSLSQIDCSLEKVSSVKLDITNSRNIL